MDAFGHVNNVVFLRYLEEARIDFMFRLAPGDGIAALSGGSVVARHEIDYKRPLVHRHEPVDIESWVGEDQGRRRSTIALRGQGRDDGATSRRASVVVPYDLAAARPRRISPEERAFLEEYLVPTGLSGGPRAVAALGRRGSGLGSRRARGGGARRRPAAG